MHQDKSRNSPTSASYATHKNSFEIEAYLIHVRNTGIPWQNSVYQTINSISKGVGRLDQKLQKNKGYAKNVPNI